MISADDISLVIPTYRRGRILLATIRRVLESPVLPGEILVVDQTDNHPDDIQKELDRLAAEGSIRYLSFAPPSIPRAMNTGLVSARGRVVLFIDDDVDPDENLVAAHAASHGDQYAAVCGQVLQPGEEPVDVVCADDNPGLNADLGFVFSGKKPVEIRNVMAGNLSVNREAAISIGGFDEQFIGSAYRFETDFARRLLAAGLRIAFVPGASLRHLRLREGGTRSQGDHLRHPTPMHSVGDYYYAIRNGKGCDRFLYQFKRPFRECINRYYLKHPWFIPRKLLSELRAMIMARKLFAEGPRLISSPGWKL